MSRKNQSQPNTTPSTPDATEQKQKGEVSSSEATPTFIVELPLVCDTHQAKILRSRFEAARNLYNALLSEALHRLKTLRNSPEWQAVRTMPAKTEAEQKARQKAFTKAKEKYGFSEFSLVNYMPNLRVSWLAQHVDSATGQKLAGRAFGAVERVCYGKARKIRFKSIGRGLDSIEGRDNVSGLHFVWVDLEAERAKAEEKRNKNKKTIALPVASAQVITKAGETTSTTKETKPEEPKRLAGYLVWGNSSLRIWLERPLAILTSLDNPELGVKGYQKVNVVRLDG